MFETVSQLAAEWLLPGILFWLVMSLFATSAQEELSTMLQSRARLLKAAIRNMLGEDTLTQKFYDHLLIKTTRLEPYSPGKKRSNRSMPDYINPRLFAQIILDWVANADQGTSSKRKPAAYRQLYQNIKEMHLKYPRLADVLEVQLIGCGDDEEKPGEVFRLFQTNLESWFNATMEETTRQYKRKARTTLLMIGFMMALFTNFDPITLTIELWNSAHPSPTTSESSDSTASAFTPVGWVISRSEVGNGHCQLFPAPGEAFGIPYLNNLCIQPSALDNRNNIFSKLLGILLGSVLISIGSQYVFDLWKDKIKT